MRHDGQIISHLGEMSANLRSVSLNTDTGSLLLTFVSYMFCASDCGG
jgi:hypothetical protein